MPRIRTIKPEFQNSASMGRVSREARLTFILLWPQCDDAGRVRGNSRMLASILYPYDDDAVALVEGWLSELEKDGCIVRYEVGGAQYLQISAWSHQKIDHPTPSKLPGPPDKKQKKSKTKPREEAAKTLEPSPKPRAVSSTVSEGRGRLLSAIADQLAPEFAAFWEQYPTDRNMSRKAAETQWNRLSPDKRAAALAAVPGFKAYCAKESSWYRPVHAERFLSQERFEGYAVDGTGQPDAAAARAAWDGQAAKLIDALGDNGAVVFSAWFTGANFVAGPPARIGLPNTGRRTQIENRFSEPLRKAFGEVILEVAA